MISEHQEEQASLYAAGALPAQEQQEFETELSVNSELRELARALQNTIARVAHAMPSAVPAALKEKIMQRIDAVETARPLASLPFGLRFLPGAALNDWKPLPLPGAAIKLLSLERQRGYAVLLGKLEPGARYPAHINSGPEDIYILTGDLVIGDHKLVAGDFHHADRGSRHEENYSVEGCTLIAVLTTDDPLVAFAMS
jgi:anti-sigma factor ChrR (cupin superfamily)